MNQIIEAELVPMMADPSGTLALARADLDVQITTAKSYPRDVDSFLEKAREWATLDVPTAESMIYEKPIAGGSHRGPSIRLAEIVQQAYGNLRVASRLVAVEHKLVVCEALAHDLEANTAFRAEVVSSIWSTSSNRRYSEDVIQSTILAAQAKARRNAILAIVPGVFVASILRAVEEKITGQSAKSDLAKRIEAMFGYWARYRVEPKEILDFLGLKKPGEITADHLITIRSKAQDLEEGTPVDQLFIRRRSQPQGAKPAEQKSDPTSSVAAALGGTSAPKQRPSGQEGTSASRSSSPSTSAPSSAPEQSGGGDESKPTSPATSSRPDAAEETPRQRARRLAKMMVADGVFKTQREVFDKLNGLCESQPQASDQEIWETVAPKPAKTEAKAAPYSPPKGDADTRFDDVPENLLDERISEYEDKVAEKDVEGLSRAQEKVPGVMEDGATPTTLRSYLRALDDELRA